MGKSRHDESDWTKGDTLAGKAIPDRVTTCADSRVRRAGSSLHRSLRKRCRTALACHTAIPPGQPTLVANDLTHNFERRGSPDAPRGYPEACADPDSEEESIHDETWHDEYFAIADGYTYLVREVVASAHHMPVRTPPSYSAPLPVIAPTPQDKGDVLNELYHTFAHFGAASLDI